MEGLTHPVCIKIDTRPILGIFYNFTNFVPHLFINLATTYRC
jgi:hypothetical protein